MARSHLFRPVQDSEGNLVPNTKVTSYEHGTTQVLAQKLYTSPRGSTVLANPFTTSSGVIDFYLDSPQSVKIGMLVAGRAGGEQYVDDIDVLPPPAEIVRAETPFRVTNTPGAGQFMQASVKPGEAAWVDAADIVSSRPSAMATVKSYDFSSSYLDDLTLTDAAGNTIAPVYADVTADPKPAGYPFLQALRMPTSVVSRLRVPIQEWPERGFVLYLYKVVTGRDGQGAASLHFSVDDDALYNDTPLTGELANGWRVGYVSGVTAGSHSLVIEHRPGTDLASYVLLGPVFLRAGDNIPAHNHAGVGSNSTRLGIGSVADADNTTVVGAQAKATGAGASVYGAYAQGAAESVALGQGPVAGPGAVAIGYLAQGSLSRTEWVAVGHGAKATADSAVALGSGANAAGARSLALGPTAQTGASGEAIAVGSQAKATGYRAVALGTGAEASHDFAVAIGYGVKTQAAHEARLGDDKTTTVIPGPFRYSGGLGAFGAPDSRLGFYGASGITRPVVQGSRQNNAVVKQLLDVLSSMGLITDRSTA
jgi:hypothetical protein